MSFGKALANMFKSDPVFTVTISCGSCDNECTDSQFCLSKVTMALDAREQGWTFDSEGTWSCPHCTKGVNDRNNSCLLQGA